MLALESTHECQALWFSCLNMKEVYKHIIPVSVVYGGHDNVQGNVSASHQHLARALDASNALPS